MLHQALITVEEGIVIIDNNLTIKFINRAAEDILGVDGAEAINKNSDEFFGHPPHNVRILEKTVEQRKEFSIEELPYKWGNHNKFLKVRTRLLKDDEKIMGAIAVFTDITRYVSEKRKLNKLIEDIAVNIVPVMSKVGVLPLQPIFQNITTHSDVLLEKTLTSCMSLKLEKLAIDLTSIGEVDDQFITTLYKLMDALNLLGIRVVITGVRPNVSATMVKAGYELRGTKSFALLSQAIDYFRKTG